MIIHKVTAVDHNSFFVLPTLAIKYKMTSFKIKNHLWLLFALRDSSTTSLSEKVVI